MCPTKNFKKEVQDRPMVFSAIAFNIFETIYRIKVFGATCFSVMTLIFSKNELNQNKNFHTKMSV